MPPQIRNGSDASSSSSKPPKITSLINAQFVLVLVFYWTMCIGIHWHINVVQPEPYMDEIFHIPQTQKYCEALYDEWDPKITTLPGTYIVATAFLRTLDKIVVLEEPCSTFHLRSFTIGVSVVNLCLIYFIIGYYSPDMTPTKKVISAVNIATFPVLYFFSFLYYTDAVSTMFLLLMHLLYIRGRYGFSALAGGSAVMTRQTNIVWVMYHGINSILDVLIEKYGDNIYRYPYEIGKLFFNNSQATKGKKGKRSKTSKRPKKSSQLPSIYRIWQECGEEFADRGYAYVLVGLAFLGFVLYNGSIVVGDKDAHQATMNFPQIGYFALVFGAFTAPFILFRIKPLVLTLIQNPMNYLTFAVILFALIYYNSPVHPYLLADNRHYTFYIWKRFFESIPCFRFLWIPAYITVWAFIFQNMGIQKVFLFAYFMCTVLNIVPQLLMEFRYFIPAYLFARMTFQKASWAELFFEFCLNQAVNLLTFHLFLNKPFKWSNSVEMQRFMW